MVGALERWDQDGNPRRMVDPKARIDAPAIDHAARQLTAGTWVFADLPAGRYDLVILAEPNVRIEGFHYPPVLEFDPILVQGTPPASSIQKVIVEQIAAERHYENKVSPLYLAGDERQVRVLVQLLRDKPTSFDGQLGQQAATLRHEVWQFTNRYGGWSKEKRTRVFDRILMPLADLRKWTWVWDARLGGIEVNDGDRVVEYSMPARRDEASTRGLRPY